MNEFDSSNSNRWKPSTTEELFHSMVHELRTPITVISGYATLLADERLKYLHPEAIENILRAAKQLEIVLNDAVDDFRALSEKPDTPAPLTGSPLVPDTSL